MTAKKRRGARTVALPVAPAPDDQPRGNRYTGGARVTGGPMVTIRVTPEEHARLTKWCAERQVTMSALLRSRVADIIDG